MVLFDDPMCLLSGPLAGSVGDQNSHPQITPIKVLPLTKAQDGMWVDFRNEPLSTKYNLTIEWDLEKDPDTDRYEINDVLEVIAKATHRYPALRSTVTLIDGKPCVQEFDTEDVNPDIRIVYREASPVSEAVMTEILRRPFDLRCELPARWTILQDTENFRVYLVAHHIFIDGQSMSLISKEFIEMLADREVSLPSLPDFSSMHMLEKAWAGSQSYQASQELLLLKASTQHKSPWPKDPFLKSSAQHDYRKIDCWSTFTTSELKEWSKLYGTSWFRVATALIGLLVIDKTRPPLGRDEVLNIALGGRPREMTSCVGQFANTLPVNIPLWRCLQGYDQTNGYRTSASLVSMFKKIMSSVKQSELFPSIELLRTCRDMNINYQPPKVTVTFSPKLANGECRMFPVEGSWDLLFCFLEYEADVKLGVIYNPRVFSGEAMRGMKSQFENLVTLSKTEDIILDVMLPWLPRYPSLPLHVSSALKNNPLRHVHHWFDAQAESSPTSLALFCSELGISLTYEGLYQSTEQKAKVLMQRGIGRECKVLLSLRSGFSVIEWLLATLKAGAAFVYLDPDFPDKQKSLITSNCTPDLIVDDENVNDLSQGYASSSSTDQDNTAAAESLLRTKSQTVDNDLAYIIYTSGSTGEPKGVMIEHGCVASYAKSMTNALECGFGTRVLQLASFSFDASVIEWTSALCTGATLCFAQYPKRLVGEYLADVIESNEISLMEITPTAFETLPMTRDLPSLRQISVGGEAPSKDLFSRWHSRVNLVNVYGPTETTAVVSFIKIDKTDTVPESLTAGYSTTETIIYICSEDFSSVLPPGAQGEICIAGPQVGRGYCEKRELTLSKFATHSNGVRMYRTGDRGCLAEDGCLSVLGRMDRELKVRGFRIAPEEVEATILDASLNISEASVQTSEAGLEMVAFVAPETANTQDAMSTLKTLLPSYKVPSKLVAVPSLPQTVSGKTDHKAVKAIRNKLLDGTPPHTVNFFNIGGHSLLVPKLHEKLKAAFPSKPIRLVDLFHKSTIKQQISLLGANEPKAVSSRRKKKAAISGPSRPPPSQASSSSIIGMAGRFPGAKTIDEFYENLMEGYSGITETDYDKETLPGNIWVKKAGTLQDIEDFDPKFWNISEEEATDMDPQQRLFLEVAYEALTDAGIDISSINSGRTGMFVGASGNAYHLHTESVAKDNFMKENRGLVAPSISARTAYHLNISGPNVTVQTNCSSSTVALSLACDAIRLGRCDTAIVGGVSVQLFNGGYITRKGQIFSERGECNPFDARADGTVVADAVVAVVLKRASSALIDEDPVYANILGTGIGSDGGSEKAGYQVPSPRGQAEVIKTAWKMANMTPEKFKYAEIHGSGTPIGDALELKGLSLAIRECGGAAAPFTVGSTKGNIGNAQHASGLVSLVKLCKSMQHGIIPVTKGLSQPNDMINRSLPLKLAHREISLERDDILAVSATGWGGVNSHLLLGFPETRVQKQSTISVAPNTWSRRTLAAPRLSQSKLADPEVVSAYVHHASKILKCDIKPDYHLKDCGLDSLKYMAMTRGVAKDMGIQPIG
ncbi:amino acid adenylation domain protein [Astrocystis sublimbata]|nr:amino acid adenylation domain protein [Astrocystis sublimbata]